MKRPARKAFRKNVISEERHYRPRKPQVKKRYQDREIAELLEESSLENYPLEYEDLPSKKKLPGASLIRA